MCGKNLIITSVSLVILMFSCKQIDRKITINDDGIAHETSGNSDKNN